MEFQTGLLGAGFIAAFHVRALQKIPGVRIKWVCDADLKKAQALAADIPGAKAVGSLDAMLAEKPDVVHVLLPPDAHASTTVSSLAAGAHVFVEKPLATSARDAQLMIAAANASGRKVGVNHNVVFNGTFRKLVNAIRAKKLGEVEHVSMTWNVPLKQLQMGQHSHWMFRSPHNILFEQAVHPLSLIQFLMGDMVSASVLPTGMQTLNTGRTFHQTWQVSMAMQRGTAQMLLSFGRDFPEISITAIGEDGFAHADLKRNLFTLRENSFQEPPLDDLHAGVGEGFAVMKQAAGNFAKMILGTVKVKPAYDPFGDSIRDSVRSFYDSLASGTTSVVDVSRGAAVVQICDTLGNAVETGAQMELSK